MTPPKTILTLADKVDAIVESLRELLMAELKVVREIELCGEVVARIGIHNGGITSKKVEITKVV